MPKKPILDRYGFPPCVMTVDDFCSHIRETFSDADWRIVAFRVRGYDGCTLTTKRGEMPGMKANRVQVEACRADLADTRAKSAMLNR